MTTDYLAYLLWCWEHLPYVIIAYVLLTLLPKSLLRMKRFADADYEANRYKYHPCLGAEQCCCRAQAQAQTLTQAPAKKARKPVTRVYPKRQQSREEPQAAAAAAVAPVKRSNVTKIARMFETGATRQVNRVSPTPNPLILPEIRMEPVGGKGSMASIEQLLQQLEQDEKRSDWRSEPMVPAALVRRRRGTSATPSTSSPLSSSPEPTPLLLRRPPAMSLKCSEEDIFQAIARSAEQSQLELSTLYAGCHSLAPVTSIDDILSERRFSRPLSAYSITDLLNEEQAACVEEATYVNETLQELSH